MVKHVICTECYAEFRIDFEPGELMSEGHDRALWRGGAEDCCIRAITLFLENKAQEARDAKQN